MKLTEITNTQMTRKQIERWCKIVFDREQYQINDDNTVSTNGRVIIPNVQDLYGFTPPKFKHIGKSINIYLPTLVSLDWLPNEITGSLILNNGQLSSLKGCPQIIDGSFNLRASAFSRDFASNFTFTGGPKEVSEYLIFNNLKISSMLDFPRSVGDVVFIGCHFARDAFGKFTKCYAERVAFQHCKIESKSRSLDTILTYHDLDSYIPNLTDVIVAREYLASN